MGLFRPRAPKPAPEGARFRFHFSNDRPDAPAPAVDLEAAVKRVQRELATLRATVAAAKGTRSAGALQADIEGTTAQATAASRVLERKRAQCVAGLIEIDEVTEIQRERDRVAAVGRAFRSELQKREAADAAQAEIDRILQAVA